MHTEKYNRLNIYKATSGRSCIYGASKHLRADHDRVFNWLVIGMFTLNSFSTDITDLMTLLHLYINT